MMEAVMSSRQPSILVVDDQPDNLRTLAAILSTEGYKVRKAVSGEIALDTACSQPPDLILLDIRMPQMDGYTVCLSLKASDTTREIPVIFLSALGDAADKVKAFAFGAVDYITKPFQAEEVIARVKNQLRLQKLSKQLTEQNVQLQQEIEERKQTEEKIKAALREKEVLLAEIHYRVKNNLYVISNLLYFQANRSKDRRVHDILQDSRNRINSMALIHEALYHHSHNFAEINLVDYVKKISGNLLKIYKLPQDYISFYMDEKTDIFIRLEQAFPCGLIVNELVNDVLRHCLKYALEGEIFVKIECMDEGQILIAIGNSDNTISSDFDLKNQKFLGLKLVTLLINQLKGMIEIERGEQTIFKIQFKLL
jgi:two-component sensor histidine kinase/CheY-like chemotaxis protein